MYDDCHWVNVDTIREGVWDPRTPVDVSRRFYLNQPTAREDAWVTPQEWAACTDATVTVKDRDDIVLFFDGSKSEDATALIGCRVTDGHIFTLGVWEPHLTGRDVPVEEVDETVAKAFDQYTVLGFFADVKEWESYTKVIWPRMYADQLVVEATRSPKGNEPIAWDMRNNVRDFTLAAELCADEIAAKAFTHDGDSRVARHVGNARRRPNRFGISVGKEARMSKNKVDAAVCVIGARMVRKQVVAKQPKRRSRKLAF